MPSHVGYGRKVGDGSDPVNQQLTDEKGQYAKGSVNPESERTENGENGAPRKEDYATIAEYYAAFFAWKRQQRKPIDVDFTAEKPPVEEKPAEEETVEDTTCPESVANSINSFWKERRMKKSDEEREKTIAAFGNMPKEFKELFSELIDNGLWFEYDTKEAAQYPGTKQHIVLNRDVVQGNDYRMSGCTFCHEAGHAVDYKLSEIIADSPGGYASLTYISKTHGKNLLDMAREELAEENDSYDWLNNEIKKYKESLMSEDPEWQSLKADKELWDKDKRELVEEKRKKAAKETIAFVENNMAQIDESIQRKRDVLKRNLSGVPSILKSTLDSMPNSAQELLDRIKNHDYSKDGLFVFEPNMEVFSSLDNTFRDTAFHKFDSEMTKRLEGETQNKLLQKYGRDVGKLYSEKRSYFNQMPSRQFNGFSDLWGATRKSESKRDGRNFCTVAFGHKNSYMSSETNCATELFADISGIIGTQPYAYDILKKRAPKTLEIYEEMLKEYGKRRIGNAN